MTDRETPAGAVEALAAALHTSVCDCPGDDAPGCHLRRVPAALRSETVLAALTASGYSLTRSVDVERWQRIETAARSYVVTNTAESEVALRDALGEG